MPHAQERPHNLDTSFLLNVQRCEIYMPHKASPLPFPGCLVCLSPLHTKPPLMLLYILGPWLPR